MKQQVQQVVENNGAQHDREPLKYIPLLWNVATIGYLSVVYNVYHCVPLLQLGLPRAKVDEAMKSQGLWQTIVFNFHCFMLVLCYASAVIRSPGHVPLGDPRWDYYPQSNSDPLSLNEKKRDGLRRYCKWCGRYKPDRCHHCKICDRCVLKMDHHCQWFANCVGFGNYKHFFLTLFYSAVSCQFMFWTMGETVLEAIYDNETFGTMFVLVFAESLACILGLGVTGFFCVHVFFMSRAMSTIEFCEKAWPKKGRMPVEGTSIYDVGIYSNIRAVLGANPLFWLIPCQPSIGDGMHFPTDGAEPMQVNVVQHQV
eukprot:TRINITY_DN4847_c0_g1_i1.p1 TRINITY_DN4847_c0_g1~~TRINITY_DN4847_c0_g1_i1.p1  ORF type:complete len:312 (+),score=40.47 TRINITY_DN4847_c0_g1_i1:47-982(+)